MTGRDAVLVLGGLLLGGLLAHPPIRTATAEPASAAAPPRRYWEYQCRELDARRPSDLLVLNQFGEKGWELTAIPSPSVSGAVMCFKREIAAPARCEPACAAGNTCLRGRCVSACAPPCREHEFCGSDRRCHSDD